MTTPDPSARRGSSGGKSASPRLQQEPQPVETPRKSARRGGRRGMLVFYVGTGVMLALFVCLYFLWTPLRLRYTIFRLQGGSRILNSERELLLHESRVRYCARRASQGNRLAMDALVKRLGNGSFVVFVKGFSPRRMSDLAYVLARNNPQAFFRSLDQRPDTDAFYILEAICKQGQDRNLRPAGGPRNDLVFVTSMYARGDWDSSPEAMAHLVAQLKSVSTSAQDPNNKAVLKATLDYTSLRYAKQLATAKPPAAGTVR
jgi:hypothetical protein